MTEDLGPELQEYLEVLFFYRDVNTELTGIKERLPEEFMIEEASFVEWLYS